VSEPDPILEAARLHYDTFTVMGRQFTVRQPSALQLVGYRQVQWEEVETGEEDEHGKPKKRRQLREDATEQGLAYLVSVCVLDDAGKPAYSLQHALQIVTGNPDVAFPFINAVTALLSGEKKALATRSASGTA
jgi:hypothetical protein